MPIYMKFAGIKGNVKGKYAGWIELDSCQFGNQGRTIGPQSGRGRSNDDSPNFAEIVITKRQDAASNQLYTASILGTQASVTIIFVKGNDAPYLSLELENTMIAGYSISGHGSSSSIGPVETLALNFTKVSYSNTPTSTSVGTPDKAVWDLAVSKGG